MLDTRSLLSKKACAEIDRWIAKYPPEQKRSALLSALHIAQEENGWLSTEVMDTVADYLGLDRISVYEVATFYTMYDLKPVGRHKISVCTNISCLLRGSEEVVAHLTERLGIKLGETTPDGKVTLREVECLAACCGAPMAQVDKQYHENLTPEKLDAILAALD